MNVYVRELGRALGARGAQVDIFTRRQECDSPDVVEYAPGVRVIHLDAGPHRQVDKYDVLDYLDEFACGIQRWRALTGMSYDVIHSHYWLSGRIGSLFSGSWQVPLVSMFHTLAQLKNRVAESAAEREQEIRHEIEAQTMAVSDRVIAATEVDRAQIVRHYGSLAPISVIPGGVDLERFRPLDKAESRASIGVTESNVLLYVGRIQRLKGLEVLLRAFHESLREDRLADSRLLIVGGLPSSTARRPSHESREIARLHNLTKRLGLADKVTFVGAIQQGQLPLYYSAADLTVMPSSYESFGLVAVESLACGTPVVATRVGGLTTIVRDGATGALVPWRDPKLFSQTISRLLLDREELRALSEQARPSVMRFGWDNIADAHLEVFDELATSRRGLTAQALS